MRAALLLAICLATSAQGAGLRAGVARKDITPSGPIWMSGYANRNHPSTGVVHPLWAKALAIDGAGGRVVIVTTDLIGLPEDVSRQIATRAQRQYGLQRARLVLNSSHTHTGPVVWAGLVTMFDLPPDEERKLRDYAAHLVDDLVAVIGQAIGDLSPAEIAYGFGQADFAVNRREPTPRGVRIGVNPNGPTDREVPVLAVTGTGGKMRAILFAYACHNTTLTGDFYQLSGDYAGFAEAKLEEEHPGATAMFLQLCGGDQNPQPRNTLELAERHGREMAAAVDTVLGGTLHRLTGPLRVSYQATRLPFARQERSVYEADAANPKAPPATVRRAKAMVQAIDASQPVWDTAYPVQAVRFGKALTLLALGGEVVVDYALRVKKEYPGEAIIVAAYSNAVMCYIPSERVLSEGGYEAVDNLVYYGKPGPFAPGVEARVFDAIHAVMKKVGR